MTHLQCFVNMISFQTVFRQKMWLFHSRLSTAPLWQCWSRQEVCLALLKLGPSEGACSHSNPPFSSPLLLIQKHLCASEKHREENVWKRLSRIDSSDSDCGNEPVTPLTGAHEVRGWSWPNAYKAKSRAERSLCVGSLSIYSSMHYLQADALWTNSKNYRSFISPPPEWKLLRSTAAVPRNASAQNKWRQKLSAINTYGRPKTRSNYQRSAWSISDRYSVISVGGCKVVLTPLVIDRMDSLWAEFQLAHKRKTYFSWQVEEFQFDSSRFCLLLVWTSPVP